jgi:hypothetical protein
MQTKYTKSFKIEAESHFDSALKAGIDFFTHCGAAAVSIETIPPLAIIEIYNASQPLIEACREYNEGRLVRDSEINDPYNNRE